jgi:hypothetical protein
MKSLKSPKMLTTWAKNMGFAPALSGKCGFLPKWVFLQSSQKVCPSTQYLILKLAAVDLNWATDHISYCLIKQWPCLKCQRDMNPTIICLFLPEAKMNLPHFFEPTLQKIFWHKCKLLGALENLRMVSLYSAGVVQNQEHKLMYLHVTCS